MLSPLQLTSQHPYAEVYIGQPHVWTVDIDNPAEVEKAIRSILSQKVITHETHEKGQKTSDILPSH